MELYNDNLVDLYWILDNPAYKKGGGPDSNEPPRLDIKQDAKKMVFIRNAVSVDAYELAHVLRRYWDLICEVHHTRFNSVGANLPSQIFAIAMTDIWRRCRLSRRRIRPTSSWISSLLVRAFFLLSLCLSPQSQSLCCVAILNMVGIVYSYLDEIILKTFHSININTRNFPPACVWVSNDNTNYVVDSNLSYFRLIIRQFAAACGRNEDERRE